MAVKKKARKTGKSKKKTGRANGTVRPSKSSSKRKPKPAVVRRPAKKTAKKTAKKRAVRKKKIPRLPRPSLAPKTIKAIYTSFASLSNIRSLEARLIEAQQRAKDEEDERKAIQDEGKPAWVQAHPSKIVQAYQKKIEDWESSIEDDQDPRVIENLARFIEVTAYGKQDGSIGLFPSRLRHIEDSEDIKKRLAQHMFATTEWNEEAKRIAKEYDVWTREVYTLFYSP